jgi:hypothetical protein
VLVNGLVGCGVAAAVCGILIAVAHVARVVVLRAVVVRVVVARFIRPR